MLRGDFVQAFGLLGARLQAPAEIVIAGGSALVLLGIVDRATADADTVASRPKLSTLSRDIEAVAEALDLPVTWINDGVTAYRISWQQTTSRGWPPSERSGNSRFMH